MAAAVKKESKNTMLRRRKVQISWSGVGGLGGIMGGGQPNRVNWHSTGSLIPSDSEF